MHVTLCHQRHGRDRVDEPVRLLVGRPLGPTDQLPLVGSLRAAVCDHSNVAQTHPDRRGGVPEMADEHNPAYLDQIGSWLHPDHFADQRHGEMFATLVGLYDVGELRAFPRAADGQPNPAAEQQAAHNIMAVRAAAARNGRASPGVFDLAGLSQAGVGLGEGQVVGYGRMVIDMFVRREMEHYGVALEAAATPETTRETQGSALQTTQDVIEANLRDLDALARRSVGDGVPSLARPGPLNPIPLASAPPLTLITGAMLAHHQRRVIHAVVCDDPTWREVGVIARLRPEDFVGSPALAATWRVIKQMHAQGEPVDPITVAWHAQGAAQTGGEVLPAQTLVSMREPPGHDVDRSISTVARAALAVYAGATRAEIHVAANDRSAPITEVIGTTRDAAVRLGEHAGRLGIRARPAASNAIARTLAGQLDTPGTLPVAGPVTRGRAR